MGTETWTPHFRILRQPWPQLSQPPGSAKPGCGSQHRQSVCSSCPLAPGSHRCFCFDCQAHRHSKTFSPNNGTSIKSLLIVPNAPSRQDGEQHHSGKGHTCLLNPTRRVGNKGKQEQERLLLIRSNRNKISACILKQQPQQEQAFDAKDDQPKRIK